MSNSIKDSVIYTEKRYKAYLSGLMQKGDMPGLMAEHIYINQNITVQSSLRFTVIDNSSTFSAAITRAGKIIDAGYNPADYTQEIYDKVFKIYR
jgi:hypothetical protein